MIELIISSINVIFICQFMVGVLGAFGLFRKICPKYNMVIAWTNFPLFIILLIISTILK